MKLNELVAALQDLNWESMTSISNGDTKWLRYSETSDIYVETRLTIKNLRSELALVTLNSFSNDIFHTTAFRIHGIPVNNDKLSSFMFRKSWSSRFPKNTDVSELSQEVLSRTQGEFELFQLSCFLEECVNRRPDIGLRFQQNHLAALAVLGKYEVLMDYLDSFKKGNRLNFLEPITTEMIDRALDIAISNSDL